MPVSAVEAEFADRMAAQLAHALGAVESLQTQVEQMRGMFDDADGAIAAVMKDAEQIHATAHAILDEYKALQDRPQRQKSSTVKVLFGESPEVGAHPDIFTFDTQAECSAFKTALYEMRGWGDFTLCQHSDEARMADGVVRRVPDGFDPTGPIVTYSLHTADDCVKRFTYGLGDDGRLVEIDPGEWAPGDPELEAVRADIEIHHAPDDLEQAELSGDQHRDLEDGGVLDDFLVLLAKRDPDGAEELLQEAGPGGVKP